MRLASIKDINSANKFLKNYYIPKHNNKFSIESKEPWDFHVPISKYEKDNLEWFFAKKYDRVIKRDWTVTHMNTKYQIHKKQHLPAWKQVNVVISMLGKVKILSQDKELAFDIIS